ncbi:MAG: methyltransferase domain-containing protein [Deltaproteobacteria bacterium]|nr:methyltransferase domain-containing protein [Deltaproteobacteria bacterium]
MQTFLHVGCVPKRRESTTRGFATPGWRELRLDIDPAAASDIVGSMTDMAEVADASVEALFSSHNLEHLFAHEVPVALAEFRRVLRPGGLAVITCPDLQSVCELVAQDKLTDSAYVSPAGPIAPLDILYGHRGEVARGKTYMAHKCGFTERVLVGTLQAAGFELVVPLRRGAPYFDLWAVAGVPPLRAERLVEMAREHLPGAR